MRHIDTNKLSKDECWGVQINGLQHCQDNCKWVGISACEGQNIRKTGYNSKGYRVGDHGVIAEDYNPVFDQSAREQQVNES
jgi:translation elongation factor EF-1alpha